MISGQFGVGYFTWEAVVDYPAIVLGMITIGFLGLACSGIIRMVGVLRMAGICTRRQAMTHAMAEAETHKGFIGMFATWA